MEPWYQKVAKNSVGGRYIFIPDSKHIPMLDQLDAVIDAVQTLVEQVGNPPD